MGSGTRLRVTPITIDRLDDPAAASADERDEHLMLLEAARHSLEVEWTETLAAAEAARDHEVMGFPSMVAYLKHRLGVAGGRAHRYVRQARAALRFPSTLASWKHRQVSTDEAELLLMASERMPDKYSQAEPYLLELVGEGVDETRRLLDYWSAEVDRAGARLEMEEQLRRRRFDLTRRQNGMVAGEFLLPQLDGETLLSALDALMPPRADGDTRTTSQRRADALGDLGRAFLEGSESPTVGGERPHVNVHVDIPALQGRPSGLHETEDGIVLDPELIRLVACDASVCRIVFGSGSEVLDVGRRTRVIPAGLRRAIVARDRHCVVSGCSRPARWSDVHHIVSWADGGETTLENLCLLCRFHHTQVHLGLVAIESENRTLAMAGTRSS